jgi:hypothetical protein
MVEIDQGWIQVLVAMVALGLLVWRVLTRAEDRIREDMKGMEGRLNGRMDSIERRLEKLEEDRPMALIAATAQRFMTPAGPQVPPQQG